MTARRTLRLALALLAGSALAACASSGAQSSRRVTDTVTVSGVPTAGTATRQGPATTAPAPSATTPRLAPSATTPKPAAGPPRPPIVWDPIPFGQRRKEQMVAYVRRHYGSFMKPTWRLRNPKVIVIHYTETPTFQATYNTFAPDTPDPELHELPNTCAHFVIDRAGIIHQLVPLDTMCRHTVGPELDRDRDRARRLQRLGSARQPAPDSASLRLVRWLRCRYRIPIRDVIGHNESLSSPYHREDVPSLRTQTHSDFDHADMNVYRHRLAQAGGCGVSPTAGA